jgi:hypothetical protein
VVQLVQVVQVELGATEAMLSAPTSLPPLAQRERLVATVVQVVQVVQVATVV